MLKLPKHPKTSAQLRFVRHWLGQLSHAHFTHGTYYTDAFSPGANPNKNRHSKSVGVGVVAILSAVKVSAKFLIKI
jgi:hypothetical protein